MNEISKIMKNLAQTEREGRAIGDSFYEAIAPKFDNMKQQDLAEISYTLLAVIGGMYDVEPNKEVQRVIRETVNEAIEKKRSDVGENENFKSKLQEAINCNDITKTSKNIHICSFSDSFVEGE